MFSPGVAAATGGNSLSGTSRTPSGGVRGHERVKHKRTSVLQPTQQSEFLCVCVFFVPIHPNAFHVRCEGLHLAQGLLSLFKLLQQLPVAFLSCRLSLLQDLPELQQLNCPAGGNTQSDVRNSHTGLRRVAQLEGASCFVSVHLHIVRS